jgi:excisionase family DNA binding protein
MRGPGDFQARQIRGNDPQVHRLFGHVRQAVDIVEQLMLRQRPEPMKEQSSATGMAKDAVDQTPSGRPKLAYTIQEAQELVGISRSALYLTLRNNNGLRAVKSGRKTLILAKDLQAWLEKLPAKS